MDLNDEEELVVDNDIVEENNVSVDDTNLVDSDEESTKTDVDTQEQVQEITKTYSQEDVDRILEARTNSLNKKHQKDLDKYRRTENILKQGLGANNIDDINSQLVEFYKDQGVDIKDSSFRNERDERVLAKADVADILNLDEDEIQSTVHELVNKEKRTVREEETLRELIHEISIKNANEELRKIGADEKITNSNEFKTFASKFNSNVPLTDIYDLYNKSIGNVKKQPPSSGSMKNNANTTEIKDFYTPEEARKFTVKDFERNPALYKAVEKSMEKWK